jgi:hypothetical protein
MLEPIPFAGMVDLDEELFIANQLTDKEIDLLIEEVPERPTDEDLYDFAIAILKKAQEK